MKREQLLRLLAKDAKSRGLKLDVDMARGKGGHCVVRCGGRFSVMKSGEVTPMMEKGDPEAVGTGLARSGKACT